MTIGDDLINGDGSWGATGTILLDGDVNIRAISTSGGQPAPVAWPDRSRGESVCTWPEFLPDGRHFIYLGGIGGRPDSTALRCGRLGSKESKLLAIGAFSRVMYSPPGYLLYLRGRTLLAQPFDSERLRLKGDAFPVVGDVLEADLAGNTEISTSATGALVYLAEFAKLDKSQLAWVDRAGMEIRRVGSPARYGWTPSLSPDEKRLAAPIAAPGENSCDIWVMDIERDVAARLTSDPGNDGFPVWSADGATIYFGAMRGGRDSRVWQKSAGGLGEERELPMPPGVALPRATTPDGRYLLASVCPEGGKFDIAEVSLDANPRTAALGIQSRGLGEGLLNLSLSADGKWIAYASDETGRSEVYVVDFPDLKGKWRLSTDGGFLPKWGRDGRELFYLAPGGQEDLVLGWTPRSVEVTTTPSFRAGKPVRILPNISDVWLLEPSSGGRRFLVGAIAKEQSLPPFQVVLNWPATVGRE